MKLGHGRIAEMLRIAVHMNQAGVQQRGAVPTCRSPFAKAAPYGHDAIDRRVRENLFGTLVPGQTENAPETRVKRADKAFRMGSDEHRRLQRQSKGQDAAACPTGALADQEHRLTRFQQRLRQGCGGVLVDAGPAA